MEHFPGYVIPLIVVAIAVISRLTRGARISGRTAAPPAAAPAVPQAVPTVASSQQRVTALLAEMRRRGITPPPALQAIAAAEGVPTPSPPAARPAPAQYAAPPQYAASPQYAAPPQRQAPPQPRQLAPQQRPFVAAVPMPLVPASARAPSSATGRMLARVFSEPGRAADAIILAEILAAPVALRATTSRPWAAL
jgi:hypothetical protein